MSSFIEKCPTFEEMRQEMIKRSKEMKEAEAAKKKKELVTEENLVSCTDKSKYSTSSDNKSIKVTEDGFKVVDFIPQDDSDVSDAFESDFSDEDIQEKTKVTEDGFKIVSSIPEDDSDVSDAFESDEDDSNEEDVTGNEIKEKIMASKKAKIEKLNATKTNGTKRRRVEEPNSPLKLKKNKKISPNHDDKIKQKEVEAKIVSNTTDEQNQKKKRSRKRGSKSKMLDSEKKNMKSQVKSNEYNIPDFRKTKGYLPFTDSELEDFKRRNHPKYIKFCEGLIKAGLHSCWEECEKKEDRDKREMARLPQPEKRPDCNVYLKRGLNGQIETVYDYSRKKPKAKKVEETKNMVTKPKTEEEKKEMKREENIKKKAELKETLKNMARDLDRNLFQKTLTPEEKRKMIQQKLERLGAPKKKNPYVNYKVLMEQRRLDKAKKEEEKQHLLDIGMAEKIKKNKVRRSFKRDANDVGGFTNQAAGSFKDGVLVLNKNFLKSVKDSNLGTASANNRKSREMEKKEKLNRAN